MILDVTAILTVTLLSIQTGLVLNRVLLTAVIKAMGRVRSAEGNKGSK